MAYTRSPVLACLLLIVSFALPIVHCDSYLHNPRGSNDRLNGGGANRANGNRLFDSQNNAKGGYNVGEFYYQRRGEQDLQYNMNYYQSGSKVTSTKLGQSLLVIEWTNQHGCGNEDLNCDVILQYKCQDNRYGPIEKLDHDTMRNGQVTATPSYNQNFKFNNNYWRKSKRDEKIRQSQRNTRGLHEPWEWYDKCNRRERNKGLFTADQNLKDTTARYTRQNPQGTQFGYECPEERDYYPYWHPTDWKDMVVMANSEKRCKYYERKSFNTNKKSECLQHVIERGKKNGFKHYSLYNNEKDCRQGGGVWVEFTNFLEERPQYTTRTNCLRASTVDVPLVWGLPYVSEGLEGLEMDRETGLPKESCLVKLPVVDCRKATYTRVNHLGNAGNALPFNYTWVLPYFPSNLEKRCVIRLRYNISTMDYDGDKTFSTYNGEKSPVKNDPTVEATKFDVPLQLAVNTAQFGRTFQDRSHLIILKPRERDGIADDVTLHNLNVRGKRGNIVQTYPAVEYDFVPNNLTITEGDYVHIQWTGSNNNPGNNDGEGKAGSDRSNIVEMDTPGQNVKFAKSQQTFKDAKLVWSANRHTKSGDDIDVSLASAGFYSNVAGGEKIVVDLGNNVRRQFQTQLDNSSPSFPGIVLQLKRPKRGVYHYMCTRNNNFTNRNQKASITVKEKPKANKN